MGVESPPDVVQLKKELAENTETNDFDPNDSYLRRGENAIQGMISTVKRKRNRVPITPLGLKKISEKDSPSDEENTEGSESKSQAYNPTSPPSTVGNTESSGSARTQGPRTTLEFTPVREPEPAVDSNSEERTDMSMFIAPS